jgi:hypothetical protein
VAAAREQEAAALLRDSPEGEPLPCSKRSAVAHRCFCLGGGPAGCP